MKNFIIRIVLLSALAVNIINLSFNTYDRIAGKPVEEHKVVEAPWYPIAWIFILANGAWNKINGGSSRYPKLPVPQEGN